MKKFEFYKRSCFKDCSIFSVRFYGNYSKEDIDEKNILTRMKKFMANSKLHDDMPQNISYIRTILKDINETLLEVVIKNDRKEEVIRYALGKIDYYSKKNYIYEEDKIFIDVSLLQEKQLDLSIKSYDNKIVDYGEIIRQNSGIIYYIESLKNIRPIELSVASKEIIEIYKLFFNEVPDFLDDIEIRVQSMISILTLFNINISAEYSFTPITDKKVPFSLTLSQIISNLYPFGKKECVEEQVPIMESKRKKIKYIGKKIMELVPKDKNLDDVLIEISKIAWAARYSFMFSVRTNEICMYSNVSKEQVEKVIDIFTSIENKEFE